MSDASIESLRARRCVSFADELEAQSRNDSTQDQPQTKDVRRPSLTKAIERASSRIGDGLCESKKELSLLGILPDPESEDEDVFHTPRSSKVSPVDMDNKIEVPTPTERTVAVPDIEAERKEEEAIRESMDAFSFDESIARRREPSTQEQIDPLTLLDKTSKIDRSIDVPWSPNPNASRSLPCIRKMSLEERSRAFYAERPYKYTQDILVQRTFLDNPNRYIWTRYQYMEDDSRLRPMYYWWTTEPGAEEKLGRTDTNMPPIDHRPSICGCFDRRHSRSSI